MQTITSLAFGGATKSVPAPTPASQELIDLYKSSGSGGAYVPKSWMTDPYSILDSLGMGYRAYPSTLSYETLRQMTEKDAIISSVIITRTNQAAAFTVAQDQHNKYSLGYRFRHKDPRRKMTHGEADYCKDLEGFIKRCGWDKNPRDNFETFVRKFVRDTLTFDQVGVEVVPKVNGKPHAFIMVPSDTIRIAIPKDRKGRPPVGASANKEARFHQVIDGTIVNEYTDNEMLFGVRNPRTDIRAQGYGYSEPEQLITTVTAHLWSEEWNRNIFKQGSTTPGILNLKGNIPAVKLEDFKRQWLIQVAGVTNAWRTPILNSDGLEFMPLRQSNNEMGFQAWTEYLIKIICAIYLIDPAELNFDMRGGVGQQPMFMSTNEAQQKVSKDRGLQPLLRFLFNLLNEKIISRIDDNFIIEPVGLDAKSEEQAIELRLKEAGSYKTLNEVRGGDGLPPVEDGDMVMNPVYVGFKNQKDMMRQGQQMGGMPGQPGTPQPAGAVPQGKPPMAPPGGGPPKAPPPMPDLGGLSNKPANPQADLGTATRDAGEHVERQVVETDDKTEHRWRANEDSTIESWEDTARSEKPDLQKGFTYIDIEL